MTPKEKGVEVIQEFLNRLEDVRYYHEFKADMDDLMASTHDRYEEVISDTIAFLKALQGKVGVG